LGVCTGGPGVVDQQHRVTVQVSDGLVLAPVELAAAGFCLRAHEQPLVTLARRAAELGDDPPQRVVLVALAVTGRPPR